MSKGKIDSGVRDSKMIFTTSIDYEWDEDDYYDSLFENIIEYYTIMDENIKRTTSHNHPFGFCKKVEQDKITINSK